MALAALADFKVRLHGVTNADDNALTSALQTATRQIERFVRRELIYTDSDITEIHDGFGQEILQLTRFPVIADSQAIKEAENRDFASAVALVADTDYYVDARRGNVWRLPNGSQWCDGPGTIQVVYRGGYQDADGTVYAGVPAVPDYLSDACLLQAAEIWNRAQEPGAHSETIGGTGAVAHTNQVALIKVVQDMVRDLRRLI